MNERDAINAMLYQIECQRKYGCRGKESLNEWILKKRSINIACLVVRSCSDIDLVECKDLLKVTYKDSIMANILHEYELQMIYAATMPEEFIRNLDNFYMKICRYVEENHLFREFFDFCAFFEMRTRIGVSIGRKCIFSAYYSLVIQQLGYFCRHNLEANIIGVSRNGELIFGTDPYPYADMGSYELETFITDFVLRGKPLTDKIIHKAYLPYGYSFHSILEAEALSAQSATYENNTIVMAPYINDQNVQMQVGKPYCNNLPVLPQCWRNTDFYLEKLRHQSHRLPASGISVKFKNAGDICKMLFMETQYIGQTVMLYHVFTYENGEYSGFFNTENQMFYSIYENTNFPEEHELTKKFVLENYMMLTCNYEIDRRKNYAIRQVKQFSGEFHYPEQPLAIVTCC